MTTRKARQEGNIALSCNRDKQIYVGNLEFSVNEDDLKKVFKDFKICAVTVLSTGTRKYAFLELDSENSIRKAVKEMPGTQLKERPLVVRAGNAKLHCTIQKEIDLEAQIGISRPVNGPSVSESDHPPPLEIVYLPCQEDDKDMPPPLEPVILNGPLGKKDMPPPLEPVFNKGHPGREDLPPPLEPVFTNEKPDLPPPLEPVFTKGHLSLPLGTAKMSSSLNSIPATVVVANFPFGTTQEELIFLFKSYSPLQVSVVVNRRTDDSSSSTYAYVTLPDRTMAEKAVYDMDDTMFKRRKIVVTYLLERIPSI